MYGREGRQAPGLGKRPVKDGGQKSTAQGWAGLQAELAGTGVHQRHLPLQPQEDSVKMERNMR